MNIEEVRKNKPEGATHYFIYEGNANYFIKSKYGFRQVKGNIISFLDSGLTASELQPIN